VTQPRVRVVLATHNAGKIAELEQLARAAEPPMVVVTAPSLGLPSPVETESTYIGNAMLKARAAAAATGEIALADDTGVEIDALGGGPGVHTADFARDHGGWPATLRHLDDALGLSAGSRPRATAVCALALAWPDGHTCTARAEIHGVLTWPPVEGRPGFAALFRADDAPFDVDGVLLHRRRAFEDLVQSCWPG
jgi:XTP/dITP diphosphohydrolase